MKIIILGAGAIGSLFGAKLCKINDVTLIARKEHAAAINKNGLKVTGVETATYALKAQTSLKKIEPNTLIVLSTKIYDSEKTINEIKRYLRKDTIILCVQNGYGSEDIARSVVGKRCLVLRGVTAVGTSFLKPGMIKINNVGYTAIENSKKSKAIAVNFSECGLNGYVSKNIKEDVWKKLIMNCVLNPATALLRMKNKEIADPSLERLRHHIITECISIAKKDGIIFDYNVIVEMIDRIRKSDNLSSMYQDILKGKKTEIDYLNGAVVVLGRKYHVETPVNESLVAMIKYLESRNDPP